MLNHCIRLLALPLLALVLWTTPVVAAEEGTGTVTVAHFAPFANTLDGTSVTVRIDGEEKLTNVNFGDIAKNLELPSGRYKIEILPTGTSTVAISGEVRVRSGHDYTVVAIGNGSNQPLELFTFVDFNAPLPGLAKLRVAHLAPFAANLNDTKVDLCTDDGRVLLPSVPYKGFTNPFLPLPAGDYNLKVTLAGSGCNTVALDLPLVRLDKGTTTELYVIGDIANQPLRLASTTDLTVNPVPPATVTVAHYAPFAKTVDGTSVTVRVNGGDVFTNFKFGENKPNVELPPGEYKIEILPTGSSDVAISGTFTLASGIDYTLAAIGDGTKQPLELFAFEDDNETLPSAAKLRVAHLAPFAANLDATKVDLCTDAGDIVLPGVPYKGFTHPALALPAGDYNLKVTLAGSNCADVALDLPSVRLSNAQLVEVNVIGDITNQPLQLVATTDLPLTPVLSATVTVAHFAPFADSVDETSVTVRVNGADALTDFKFGDTAANLPLAAGSYLVEILPTGTPTVAMSSRFTLTGGVDYTVAAIGNGSTQPLELFAFVDDTQPATDTAKVRIAHFAPFAAELDKTNVDICTDTNSVLLPGVPYKGFTAPYLSLPPGDYNLKIALAGTNCAEVALDLPSVRLIKGDLVELYAIGDLENQPLQLAATTPLTLTPAQSTITIKVDARPDSIRNFRFFSTLGTFRLDDSEPQDDDSVGNNRTFTVMPGKYIVAELVPYRWYLTNLTCTGGQTTINLQNALVEITVGNSDTVTCTFENSRHAHIRTRVYNDRDGNGQRNFEPSLKDWGVSLYDSSGKLVAFVNTNGNGKANFYHLMPGQYTVCQTTRPGWVNTQPATLNPAFGNQPCYTFTAAPKEKVTLLFGNIEEVGFVAAANADAMSGLERNEDDYVDHNNAAYLLEGDFVDVDADTPAMIGKLYMPMIVR